MKIYLLLFILFLAGGCAVNQDLQPSVFYQRDMEISANGLKGVGTLVIPMGAVMKFGAKARGKLDKFVWSTCQRSIAQEYAWDDGLFESKYETHFEYRPTPLERTDCGIQLEGYEKIKGRHSWGFVDFLDGTSTLPATMFCNGEAKSSPGVSICQSKAGLRQQISFPSEVLAGTKAPCPQPVTTDGKVFTIELGVGECRYNFLEKEGERNHRLTTLGWQAVPLRQD